VRRLLPRVFFVVVVLGQLYFIQRGYRDPHKHFAFQPYNESDEYHATVERVTVDGRRVPVTEPYFGYRWHELVRTRGLGFPGRTLHAGSGARAVIAFLDEALDWVADHTPRDRETLYYQARVRYRHNTRGPFVVELQSKRRAVDGRAQVGR